MAINQPDHAAINQAARQQWQGVAVCCGAWSISDERRACVPLRGASLGPKVGKIGMAGKVDKHQDERIRGPVSLTRSARLEAAPHNPKVTGSNPVPATNVFQYRRHLEGPGSQIEATGAFGFRVSGGASPPAPVAPAAPPASAPRAPGRRSRQRRALEDALGQWGAPNQTSSSLAPPRSLRLTPIRNAEVKASKSPSNTLSGLPLSMPVRTSFTKR